MDAAVPHTPLAAHDAPASLFGRLSPRNWRIVLGVAIALAVVAGTLVYRAEARRAEAQAVIARQQAQEWQAFYEEHRRIGAELWRQHRAILDASPSLAALTPAPQASSAPTREAPSKAPANGSCDLQGATLSSYSESLAACLKMLNQAEPPARQRSH